MDLQTIALFFLVTVAAGGAAWVFVYPILSGERQTEKRVASVARSDPGTRVAATRGAQKSRREQVEESLKELEMRQRRAKRPPLPIRINQAGLNWSKRGFILFSVGLGFIALLAGLVVGAGLIVSLALAFAFSLGVPHWLLSYLKTRRENRFLDVFPDAVDVIVRGVKAGLPLLDCLKIVANEATDPLKSEFRAIVETQTIGLPLGEAVGKLYERIPLAETNFFAIVILIQQKSGGNLSEALGNLSRVLRDRKRMKAKIKAISMEAKASATIIAALPIAVMLLVYMTSPAYIELLWIRPLGRLMLACSAAWMLIGVLVMRKMINFDF
jgi:tight adherence protein B